MNYTRSYELGNAHSSSGSIYICTMVHGGPARCYCGFGNLIRIIILKKLKLIKRIFDVVAFDNTEVGLSNAYRNSNGFCEDINEKIYLKMVMVCMLRCCILN